MLIQYDHDGHVSPTIDREIDLLVRNCGNADFIIHLRSGITNNLSEVTCGAILRKLETLEMSSDLSAAISVLINDKRPLIHKGALQALAQVTRGSDDGIAVVPEMHRSEYRSIVNKIYSR